MLSDAVNDQSRLLYHRTPRDRVEKVAPWLTLDGNAYPAVVGGRIQWIVDGYTTSSRLPVLAPAVRSTTSTSDSLTATLAQRPARSSAGQVNYIRNSVKATVDAYDGTVRLYAWDDQDPVLKAWSKTFPGTVQPMTRDQR